MGIQEELLQRDHYVGKCIAFLQADEEQGSFTLHSHCLLLIGGFDEIKELIFDQNSLINQVAHEEIFDFVDKFFCSSYEYIQNIHAIHEECKECKQCKKCVMKLNHKH